MAWYPVNTYTPHDGPVAANPTAGGVLQDGWIDEHGSAWSVNSSNKLVCVTTGFNPSPWGNYKLLRPTSENPTDYNYKNRISYTRSAGALYHAHRVSNGGKNLYCATVVNDGGNVGCFKVVNDGITGVTSVVSSSGTFGASIGDTVISEVSVTQFNSTTTYISATQFASDGTTQIATITWQDSQAELQNVNGQSGLFSYDVTSPVNSITGYTDVAQGATGYTFTRNPVSGLVGSTSTLSFALVGGAVNAAGVITPSDSGGGGSFSPTSLSIASGATTIPNIVYTAGNTTGAKTLSVTHTGLGFTGDPASQTYTVNAPAAATGYTASANPTSLTAGGSTTISFAFTGGQPSASGVINYSDGGAGGVFNPTSLSISSGATSIPNVTYTAPSGTATRTISFSHTGLGFSGDPGSIALTVTAAAVTILANDTSAVVASPYNWVPHTAFTGALKCWQPGAYMRFYVSGLTSGPTLNIDPNSATNGSFCYRWDNGPLSTTTGTAYNGVSSYSVVAPPDSGAHVLWVFHYAASETGRWDGTGFFGIKSLTLPSGGVAGTAVRQSKNIYIQGDSITEGIAARDGAHANPYDYSYYLGQALYGVGFEYGINACGNGGYNTIGSGNVPAAPTWWSRANSANSLLSSGSFITPPDIYIENWGANDGIQGTPSNTVAAAVQSVYSGVRAAAPNCVILKLRAFGGYAFQGVTQGIAGYLASRPGGVDSKFREIDLNIANRETQYGGLHPGIWGHANIGSLTVSRVLSAYDQISGGGSAVAAGNVRLGVDNGAGIPGTLKVPTAGQVQQGVQFGAGGTEYTGTLASGGGGSSGTPGIGSLLIKAA